MQIDVCRDLQQSATAFQAIIWPRFADALGGGSLTPVEAVSAKGFERDLDVLAGIDAWIVQPTQSAIFGVASRTQPIMSGVFKTLPPLPYDTFTIRLVRDSGAITEYEKRLAALSNGALYPAWTIQAYYRDDDCLSGMAVRTHALMLLAQACVESAIHDGAYQVKHDSLFSRGWGVNRTSNASFLWLSFEFVKAHVNQAFWHQYQSLTYHLNRGSWLNWIHSEAAA